MPADKMDHNITEIVDFYHCGPKWLLDLPRKINTIGFNETVY